METVIMNFGDNIRVINDSNNVPIAIPIGAIVRADVHEVHLKMLQRGIRSETLIAISEEMVLAADDRFKLILQVMRDIDSEDYDGLLERFNMINGTNPDSLRPTRDMLRVALRELARQEVNKMLNASRVTIREQGDEVTRKEVPPPPPPKQAPPKEDARSSEKKAAGTDNRSSKPRKKIVRVRL